MQASEWAGRVGETWADEWVRTDRTFAPVDVALVAAVVDRLAGAAAPRLLDVGCGAGRTSLSLAAALPDAAITGLDLSPALVAAADARADAASAGVTPPGAAPSATALSGTAPSGDAVPAAATGRPRCRFVQGDATVWAGERDFDALVSRHGVMFFDDPVAAFAHLRTRARPGAPLLFSCFRSPRENVWASGLAALMPAPGDPHAPGPFAFADAARVATILAAAGWRDAAAVPLDFGYVAGAGDDPVADAVDFFRRIGPAARALRDLEGGARAALLAGLEQLVRDHLVEGRVVFPAAAWIWSARA